MTFDARKFGAIQEADSQEANTPLFDARALGAVPDDEEVESKEQLVGLERFGREIYESMTGMIPFTEPEQVQGVVEGAAGFVAGAPEYVAETITGVASNPGESAKSVGKGALDSTGMIPEFVGSSFRRLDGISYAKRMAALEDPEFISELQSWPERQQARWWKETNRLEKIAAVSEDFSAPRSDMYTPEEFGQDIREEAESIEIDPEFAESPAGQVTHGAGSMAPMLAGGMFTGTAKTLIPVVSSGSMLGQGGVDDYRDAMEQKGLEPTLEDEQAVGMLNAALAPTEFLPVQRILKRLDVASGGSVGAVMKRYAGDVGAAGLEEMVAEIAQGVGSNYIASDIVSYDEARELGLGVDEGGYAGLTIGSLIQAMVGAPKAYRDARRARQQEKGVSTDATPDLSNEEPSVTLAEVEGAAVEPAPEYRGPTQIMREKGLEPIKRPQPEQPKPRTRVQEIVEQHRTKMQEPAPEQVRGPAQIMQERGLSLGGRQEEPETLVQRIIREKREARVIRLKREGGLEQYSQILGQLQRENADANGEQLDANRDDILVAIAKLGGLNPDELGGEVDVATMRKKSRVGRPIVRKTGEGLTLDHMAESLSQEGFTAPDGGALDPNSLVDLVDRASRGESIYSLHSNRDGMVDPDGEIAKRWFNGDKLRLENALAKFIGGLPLTPNQQGAIDDVTDYLRGNDGSIYQEREVESAQAADPLQGEMPNWYGSIGDMSAELQDIFAGDVASSSIAASLDSGEIAADDTQELGAAHAVLDRKEYSAPEAQSLTGIDPMVADYMLRAARAGASNEDIAAAIERSSGSRMAMIGRLVALEQGAPQVEIESLAAVDWEYEQSIGAEPAGDEDGRKTPVEAYGEGGEPDGSGGNREPEARGLSFDRENEAGREAGTESASSESETQVGLERRAVDRRSSAKSVAKKYHDNRDGMTQDELLQLLSLSELTPLRNKREFKRVWQEHQRKKEADPNYEMPAVVSIDADSLKWFNDNLTHEAGDNLLLAVADALIDVGADAFHLSGDEFLVLASSERAGHETLKKAQDLLAKVTATAELTDGNTATINGYSITYGIGDTLKSADAEMMASKNEKEANGERAARGEQPATVTFDTSEAATRSADSEGTERSSKQRETDPRGIGGGSSGVPQRKQEDGARLASQKSGSQSGTEDRGSPPPAIETKDESKAPANAGVSVSGAQKISWKKDGKRLWRGSNGMVITDESMTVGGEKVKSFFVYANAEDRERGNNFASAKSYAEAKREAELTEGLQLEQQTEEGLAEQSRLQKDAAAKADKEEREAGRRRRADSEAKDFRLSGSSLPADIAAAGGQRSMLDAVANEADPAPTEAQKEAGNYKKSHIRFQGLDITIENARGSVRSGTSPDGAEWENELPHHYGYIKRTEGADGDHVDVFIGTDADSAQVFVIDQIDENGEFDEHKVMLGFSSEKAARDGYRASYDKGWKVGPITAMSMDEFKVWLASNDTTKPLKADAPVKAVNEAEQKQGGAEADAFAQSMRDNAASFAGTYGGKPLAPLASDLAEHAITVGQRFTASEVAALAEKHGVPESLVHELSRQPFAIEGLKGSRASGAKALRRRIERSKKAESAATGLTAKQRGLMSGIEKYLGFGLMGDAFNVKRNIIGIETGSLSQQQIHAIESHGKQFGGYRVEPGGHKKINLILAKQTDKQQPANSTDKKPKSKPSTPIDDFGERLEGARKDEASKLKKASEADTASSPLSKSWPQPDYQKMLVDGFSAEAVAFIRALRDSIAAKPKRHGLKSWADRTEKARAMALDVINDPSTANTLLEKMRGNSNLGDITGLVDLYLAAGHSQSLKGLSFGSASYSIYDGVPQNPSKVVWEVRQQAKASGFSNMPRVVAKGGSREEALDAFKKAVETFGGEKGRAKKPVRFDIYSNRSKPGVWFIGKKIGRNYVELESFDSANKAREYLANNQRELEDKLAKIKEVPDHRKQNNSPRVGVDHRKGADVTPEQFAEAFGFRGVQFGNWVEQGKRQQDLNEAYDALLDLAGILNVPAKALSLNGELGLAFGARGKGKRGGVAAKAHYEPGHIVINLTKKAGAGSLAHEWWHALDNYFARERGGQPDHAFATDGSGHVSARPEVLAAFREVMQAINRTRLKRRSKKLDSSRAKPYWSTGIEMSARSFESYVIERLRDQGGANDYLANIVGQDYWDAAAKLGVEKDDSYPYPEAAEIPQIRAAFDNFFQVVESRETEEGSVLLYSEKEVAKQSGGLSSSALQMVIRKALGEELADSVIVVQSAFDLPGPGAGARQLNVASATGSARVEGVLDPNTGEIYLVADSINSESRAVWVAWHELWHRGIRSVDGKSAKIKGSPEGSALKQAINRAGLNKSVKLLAEAIMRDRGMAADQRQTAIEEALAELNAADETGNYAHIKERYGVAIPSGLRSGIRGHIARFIGAVRAMLRKLGIGRNVVLDYEVFAIITGAREGYHGKRTSVQRAEVSETKTDDYRPRQADLFTEAPEKTKQEILKAQVRTEMVETGSMLVGLFKGNSAISVAHMLRPISNFAQEVFVVVPMDANGKPLGMLRASKGTVDAAAVYPGAIAGDLMLMGADSYWVAHNHPSGMSTPSSADYAITAKLDSLVSPLGIKMNGHVVIGDGQFASFQSGDGSAQTLPFSDEKEQLEPIRIYERMVVERNPEPKMAPITSPDMVYSVLHKLDIDPQNEAGVVLLDNQHAPLAVHPFEGGDPVKAMASETGKRDLVSAAAQANAAAAIVYGGGKHSFHPISKVLDSLEIRLLDNIYSDDSGNWKSSASEGVMEDSGSYDQEAESDLDVSYDARMARAVEQGFITDLDALYERKAEEQGGRDVFRSNKEGEDTGRHSEGNGDPATPQRLFHGTASEFGGFVIGHRERKDTGWLGQGVYLTDRPELAASYANIKAGNAEPNIIPLFARLQNPYIASLEDKKKLQHRPSSVSKDFSDSLIAQGYDGVILAFKDVKEIVVFDPSRVRSVHANFDPEKTGQSDLLFSYAPAQEDMAAESDSIPPEESRFRTVQRALQDRFNRFTVVQAWLKEKGVELSDGADVYRAEERMHGRVAARLEDFRERLVRPLVKRINGAGYSMAQVAEFLHAQHARERNAQIAKVNKSMPDGGSGMSNAEADEVLSRYESDVDLHSLANELRGVSDASRQMLLDEGIISEEMAGAWQETYTHYVPLKGGPDSSLTGGTGRGLTSHRRIKRALGHSKRDDGEWIVENILADHERTIMMVEKNRVARHLLKMAIEANNPDLLTVGKPEKRGVLKNKQVSAVWYRGSVVAAFDSAKDARRYISEKTNLQGISSSDFAVEETSEPDVVYMARPQLADNETQVYVDGHAIRIQLNDELLARAWNRLGDEAVGTILQLGRNLNRYLSQVYTGYNPEFLITNMVRDLFTGTANLTGEMGGAKAIKALSLYPAAFKQLLSFHVRGEQSPELKSYREDGGQTGAAWLSDLERVGDDVRAAYEDAMRLSDVVRKSGKRRAVASSWRRVVRKTLKWLENINAAGENAFRFATYMAVINGGGTRKEAVSAAKNVTVNFNRKGEMGAALGAMYLFFNPAIQGTASIAHAHFKGKHKKQAWALSAEIMTAGFLYALVNGGADDDEWEGVEEWEKERHIMVKTSDGWLKIPLPYGHGWFWSTGRHMADLLKGESDGEAASLRIAASFVEEFTLFGPALNGGDLDAENMLFLAPTVIQIAGAPAVNQTSMGRDVYPEMSWDDSAPDHQKMYRNTRGSIAEMVSSSLNSMTGGDDVRGGRADVSPETLKYYWRTFTGGAGAFFSDSLNLPVLIAQGVGPKDLESNEIPMLRRFYRGTGVRDSRARYYQATESARTALAEFDRAKRMDKQGEDAELELTKKYGLGQLDLVRIGKMAERFSKVIRLKREAQVAIMLDDEKPLGWRRAQVRKLEAEESQLYDSILERMGL